MIPTRTYDVVTLTANPSIDRTVTLDLPLNPGGVHRITDELREPGGKGLNVAGVAQALGASVLAVAPLGPNDPLEALADVPLAAVRIDAPVRTNLAIIDPAGVTTKVNEAGPALTHAQVDRLVDVLAEVAAHARAVVLAGSLPAGVGRDFYPRTVEAVRAVAPSALLAVDTSDEPLLALAEALPQAAPDLVKPNASELAQMVGADPLALEAAADAGDLDAVVAAAQSLVARGIPTVLATLGGAGAIVVTATEAWHATSPDVPVRSTVGAGDAALTGFVLARLAGAALPEALQQACACGSAAAAQPGTGRPDAASVHPELSHLTLLERKGHHE